MCILATIVVAGVALTVGQYTIGFFEAYGIVWDHIVGNVTDTVKDFVVVGSRLPRIVTGILAGAGLAVCGVAMQSILKNPLADPYTTGVSSGAGFGATLAMTMGASFAIGQYAVVLNAFVFSLVPMVVILFVSKIKGASPTIMIMAGVAIMYVFNAVTTIFKLWADPNDLAAVYNWQVGSLSIVKWEDIPIIFAATTVGSIILMVLSRQLNILSIGDEGAKALGVDAEKVRIFGLIIVALVSAVIVSFTGLIGFVGIVAPHVVRIVIGPDNRYLLPASAMFGALLLVAADLLGRTIIAPTVLQVGVITAFIGGPMFLWLIVRRKSTVWG